jgi:hypothetical protein
MARSRRSSPFSRRSVSIREPTRIASSRLLLGRSRIEPIMEERCFQVNARCRRGSVRNSCCPCFRASRGKPLEEIPQTRNTSSLKECNTPSAVTTRRAVVARPVRSQGGVPCSRSLPVSRSRLPSSSRCLSVERPARIEAPCSSSNGSKGRFRQASARSFIRLRGSRNPGARRSGSAAPGSTLTGSPARSGSREHSCFPGTWGRRGSITFISMRYYGANGRN